MHKFISNAFLLSIRAEIVCREPFINDGGCKNDGIVLISKVIFELFKINILFYTTSTAKLSSFPPFQPVKWKLQFLWTFPTTGVSNLR